MSPDDPRHGTYAGAVQHWASGERCCPACLILARRESKRRKLAGPQLVQLGDEAWHIIATSQHSLLARESGVGRRQLLAYEADGPRRMVNRRTRDKILAATVWSPVGIQRRLRALSACGWSMQAVADHAGLQRDSLRRLRSRQVVKSVKVDFGDAICAAYEALAYATPPSERSRVETLAKSDPRWLPPAAWDNIDDPDEKPTRETGGHDYDEAVVLRILAGEWALAREATPTERREVVSRWTGPVNELARRTSWKPERYFSRRDGAA